MQNIPADYNSVDVTCLMTREKQIFQRFISLFLFLFSFVFSEIYHDLITSRLTTNSPCDLLKAHDNFLQLKFTPNLSNRGQIKPKSSSGENIRTIPKLMDFRSVNHSTATAELPKINFAKIIRVYLAKLPTLS